MARLVLVRSGWAVEAGYYLARLVRVGYGLAVGVGQCWEWFGKAVVVGPVEAGLG